jgi:hypothetical protein
MGGGSAPTQSSSSQTSISNSYNKTWSLANVGNIGFGDEAVTTLTGGDTTIDKALPWILGAAVAIMALQALRD